MSLSVYACGGTAINISKLIQLEDVQINLLDSSDSNLAGSTSKNVFLLEKIDGAGKDRRVIYDYFKNQPEVVEEILVRFKPSEQLNVVLCSITGGTGSMMGAYIAKELAKQGKNFVVVAINQHQSAKELENGLNSLKTYQGMFSKLEHSVSMYYIENRTRAESDREAVLFINLMAMLVDRSITQEFDTSDLRSFLQFEQVTRHGAGFSVLEVGGNTDVEVEKGTGLVASLLVHKDPGSTISPALPSYFTNCLVKDDSWKSEDIRINSILGKVVNITDRLEKELAAIGEQHKLNKVRHIDTTTGGVDGVFV